jgi:phosphatidate cytidylyltransferase
VTRLLSGLVLIAATLGGIWLAPHWGLVVLVEAVLVAACFEYVDLMRKSGVAVPRVVTTAAAGVVCATVAWPGVPLDLVLIAILLAVGATVLAAYQPASHVPASAAATVFPVVYLGVPLGTFVVLRESFGREVLLLVLAVVIASDTAQFYVGSRVGKRRLAPTISPKKSVEGAVGGFIVGTAVAVGLGRVWLSHLDSFQLLVLGPIVVALGITGDLFESLLKRSANVKDSSNLIPGHGGVLDRIDALLFAVPGFYLLVRLLTTRT